MTSFLHLGVGEKVLKAIDELGFENPTPVQQQAIPILLTNQQDFLGLAQTGTGKTAAYGLPLIELLDYTKPETQALILAPTRELCIQITGDMERFSKFHTCRVTAVYGGAGIEKQIRQIRKGVQVMVATPGRLIDLIGRKAISLDQIRFVVLDEADEMLNMGFQDDIDEILSHTPAGKRVWLFSATMPAEIRRIASRYMNNPFELTIGRKNEPAANIGHRYYIIHERDRYSALKRIIDAEPEIFAIVFARTKADARKIAENLILDGYNADSLHGDLSQQQREKVMSRYRNRSLQILVATDVAARGIDVENVTHVIHYHLPDEAENYAHRSGRTARAGKSGISAVLINTKETGKIRQIEKKINVRFHLSKIPDAVEVCEQQLLRLIRKIREVKIDKTGISKYLPLAHDELASLSREELIERIISLEFNRFLDYYRHAPDLNVDIAQQSKYPHGDSDEGHKVFINLGSMDGLNADSMRQYIARTAGIPENHIGNVFIKGVYSFVFIPVKYLPALIESFTGEVFNGRKVRIETGNRQLNASSRTGKKTKPGNRHSSHETTKHHYNGKSQKRKVKKW